jgi:hypothetical protein
VGVDVREEAVRRYVQATRDFDDGRQARLPPCVLQKTDLGAMQAGALAKRLHRDPGGSPDAPDRLAESTAVDRPLDCYVLAASHRRG